MLASLNSFDRVMHFKPYKMNHMSTLGTLITYEQMVYQNSETNKLVWLPDFSFTELCVVT